MIKIKLLLVLCVLMQLSLSAQYFGSADSHWIYDRIGRNGYTEVSFNSEVVIDDLSYNQFDIIRYYVDNQGDTIQWLIDPLYLGNTDGLVMHSYDRIVVDTLIDYNAVPGDSWTLPHIVLSGDRYKIEVLDTMTLDFRHRSYRALDYMISEIGSPEFGSFRDTIYEHWGFRHNFILPYDWIDGFAGNQRGGPLLCFTNDALGTIEVGSDPGIWLVEPFPYVCDVTSSVDELDVVESARFKLFPNPVSDWLTVSVSGVGSSYAVHSVSGEMRMRGELSLSDRIDVTSLSAGLYFIEIDGVVRKFVKVE